MTAPLLTPDATRCPDCSARLAGTGTCPSCGLRLTGLEATRLWTVDLELLGLERKRSGLLRERADLLRALRPGGSPDAAASAPQSQPGPLPRQEWTPQRVQNLLLTLGGLLLAGAALVFAVVTYERLGATGRAVVLAALTVVAAVAAPRLRARGLVSTAESVGALALVLAALDAYGLRTLGLAEDSDPAAYAAGSAAVLAGLAGAYARVVPLRGVRVAAVVLAQLPVPLLLVSTEATSAAAGMALAALAAADVAALVGAGTRSAEVRTTLVCSAALALLLALSTSLGAAYVEDAPAGAAALAACAAVLALAAAVAAGGARAWLGATVVPVLGAAAAALVADDGARAALALAGVALVGVLAAAQLPAAERTGPACGALAVAAAAVGRVAEPVLDGVLRPLTWLGAPWGLSAETSARAALAPGSTWDGPASLPLVLLLTALAALVTARALPSRIGAGLLDLRLAAAPAGGLLLLAAAVLVPVALDLPLPVALAVLLVLGVGVAGAGVAVRGRREAPVLVAAGTALVLHAALWSLAAQTPTLLVLPVAALVCAGLATARVPLPAALVLLAGLLGTAELAAAGVVADLSIDQVGALLVPAVALLAGTAALLDRDRQPGAEAAAVVAAVVALASAAADVGWLSWTFAGLGAIALATALRPDRRSAAALGALLLSASSWVRLADAGVTAPEPYVLPIAVVALLLGHLRRRADAATTSWAYAPGLGLALLPSLLQSLADQTLTRSLLVGLAALAVVLLGARGRLQAPLVVGALVLGVVALDLLGPYAAALPRWLSLGAAGALLLVVGATYEQRRRDLDRLRARYEALA